MIALATVLSLVKVFEAPYGGSVTLGSMIPILFIALRWGPGVGVLTGLVYGFVQYVVGPYFVHPVQVALDYPVAFGALGLAGFLPRQPWAGIALGMTGRFVAHLISGVVFFAEFAGDQNVWVYSSLYNAGYLVPELIISAVLLTVMPRLLALAKRQDA